jgi:hypothetical protein
VSVAVKNLQYMPENFVTTFRAVDTALTRLISSIPPAPPASLFPQPGVSFDISRADLTVVQTLARSNVMRLHSPFSDRNPESHQKMITAAQEVLEIAQVAEKTKEIYWHIALKVR